MNNKELELSTNEEDQLELLNKEFEELVKGSNEILYTTKLSDLTKDSALISYRKKLVNLKDRIIEIKRKRNDHKVFLDSLQQELQQEKNTNTMGRM